MDREVSTFVTDVAHEAQTPASPGKPKKTYPAAQVIGDRIRAARIAANKTQQELADNIYSKSYISAIERAKMTPSLQTLTRLAARLNVPVSYFFGEDIPNQGASATQTGSLDVTAESERVAREEAALLNLSQAETLIRQDRPHEALELLGSEPSANLPVGQRPQWYVLTGWAATLEGRAADATRVLEEGFRLAEHLRAQAFGAQREQAAEMVERLRCFLGVAACAGGQVRLAIEYHRKGLAAIEAQIIKDPEIKMLIYKGLGNEYRAMGWYQEAIGFYKKAIEQTNNLNNERQRGLALWGLGQSYQYSGDLSYAEECYRETLQALGPLGNRSLLAEVRILLGQILIKQERYEEAEEQLRRCLESAQGLGNPSILGHAWGNIAALHHARGELDQAIQAGNEGLRAVAQSEDNDVRGQLQLTLAAVYEAIQDNVAAERLIREAISSFERTQHNYRLERVHDHYAQFLAKQGRPQEAYKHMYLAREVISRRPEHQHC